MNGQDLPAHETPDPPQVVRAQPGWGFWALSVLALAAVGALSYRLGAAVPFATLLLPPATMLLFGFLAAGVYGFALRRLIPPARWWILASALAGILAAWVSVVSTSLAQTAGGLLAGWAYAWAAYGALFGVMAQRIARRRALMLASLAAWAAAGIVSAVVGWAMDIFQVTETVPTTAFFDMPTRTWSNQGLALMGALCGATGGAITSAALVLLSRGPALPQGSGVKRPQDTRLVNIAGVISGLGAALLCTYAAPLVLIRLMEGSLDSVDLTIFFLSALYASPVCIPTIALVSIPLAVGCGYAGLEIGRASGKSDPRLWVWAGAAAGGVAGYLLGSLVAFAFSHLRG
jgi:hypothetical protein